MAFDLTPDLLADVLTPYLGERPTVEPVEGGVGITALLPLAVVVLATAMPAQFDVRCYQRIDGLPVGIAYLAANDVNFDSSSGARARVFPSSDHVVLLVDNGVCGPIVPGQDFAVAIRTVLDGVEAYHSAVGRFLAMQDAFDGVARDWATAGPDAAPVAPRAVSAVPADGPSSDPGTQGDPGGPEPGSGAAPVPGVGAVPAQRFEVPGYL